MSLPWHHGVAARIKTMAKSMQLKTEDVKGVIADLHAHAVAQLQLGRKVDIPQLATLKLKPENKGRKVEIPQLTTRFERKLKSSRTLPNDTL